MFSFLKDDQYLINLKVQWRYINLLLVELNNGAREWITFSGIAASGPTCYFSGLSIEADQVSALRICASHSRSHSYHRKPQVHLQ